MAGRILVDVVKIDTYNLELPVLFTAEVYLYRVIYSIMGVTTYGDWTQAKLEYGVKSGYR